MGAVQGCDGRAAGEGAEEVCGEREDVSVGTGGGGEVEGVGFAGD